MKDWAGGTRKRLGGRWRDVARGSVEGAGNEGRLSTRSGLELGDGAGGGALEDAHAPAPPTPAPRVPEDRAPAGPRSFRTVQILQALLLHGLWLSLHKYT